tara:strand:+ start:53 stop:289 length:237 start_codon:yes stop_codon:yes gene_type:complete
MTQLLSSLQKLYESKILEADHQIKHYSTNALAIADHSEFTKEIDKWIDIKSHYEGKLRQVLFYMPKPEKKEEVKKDGK